MNVRLLPSAHKDLESGILFYEHRSPGLGAYFLTSLENEIDELQFQGGIHPVVFNFYHVKYSRRFPYAIYYYISDGVIMVDAVLDCRRSPESIHKRLK